MVHQVFATVVRPLLTAVNPKTVLEVGAGQGRLTRWLIQHSQATIHAVDPTPAFDPDLLPLGNGRLVLHATRSLEMLRGLPPVDLAILDGDPNWYTVITELRLLAGDERGIGGSPPVIVLHNVDWPFGRRDGYYDPDVIPEAWRSPNAALGLLPGHPSPSEQGLALVPFVGLEDRLPNAGVRTAIEDFLTESPNQWRFVEVPGLHGVGVLAPLERLSAHPKLAQVLDGYERVEFISSQLETVERERVSTLIRSGMTDVDQDRLDALRRRVESLERDRDALSRDMAARLRAHEARAIEARSIEARSIEARSIEARSIEARAIEARVRFDAAERELERSAADLSAATARVSELERAVAEAETKGGGLQAELERERGAARLASAEAARRAEALETARDEAEQLRAGLTTLLEERIVLAELAARVAGSHAWRIGHRLTSLARLITFRRNTGTSAVGRLQQRLAPSPLELPAGPGPTRGLPELTAPGEPEELSAAP